jgi:hypothetical protein
MRSQLSQPVTWQWLERELASRLGPSKSRSVASEKPLAEVLDERLHQTVPVKQADQRASEERQP